MRSLAFALLFALSACAENTFTVEDERGAVTTANLVLCGSTTRLKRLGGRLTVRTPIDCEGSGYIRLTYASGGQMDCLIGYVTPGAEQVFTFRANETECQPLFS